MAKRVLLVRHSAGPHDDRVAAHLASSGYEPVDLYPFRGDAGMEITEKVAGLVVYGGMYNAYDILRHPFLKDEYRLIDGALTAGLPVLGICQGAQMIAHHLGAFAGPPGHGLHEFGMYEVTPVDPANGFLDGPLWVSQAHFHEFGIPSGAEHLARSEMFENQAFRIGASVYGFQFHPEVTPASFSTWQDASDQYSEPGAQTRDAQDRLIAQHDAAQAAWFSGFLHGLFPEGQTT